MKLISYIQIQKQMSSNDLQVVTNFPRSMKTQEFAKDDQDDWSTPTRKNSGQTSGSIKKRGSQRGSLFKQKSSFKEKESVLEQSGEQVSDSVSGQSSENDELKEQESLEEGKKEEDDTVIEQMTQDLFKFVTEKVVAVDKIENPFVKAQRSRDCEITFKRLEVQSNLHNVLAQGEQEILDRYGNDCHLNKCIKYCSFIKPYQIVTVVNRTDEKCSILESEQDVVKIDLRQKVSTVLLSQEKLQTKVITFLQVCYYNTRYLLIGYKNGLLEIRDVDDREKTEPVWAYEYDSDKAIKHMEFMPDLLFGALAVVTSDKNAHSAIEIFILKYDEKEAAFRKKEVEKKKIRDPQKGMLDKTYVFEGKGQIFIAAQKSQTELVLIDMKKACISGVIFDDTLQIQHEDQIVKDEDGKTDIQTCLKAIFVNGSTIVTHFMTSVQIWDLDTKKIKGSIVIEKTLDEGVAILKTGKECTPKLAISTEVSSGLYSLENLSLIKLWEKQENTPDYEAARILVSPCNRIYVKSTGQGLSVFDARSDLEVLKYSGETKIRAISTDLLIFMVRESKESETQMCVLDFIQSFIENEIRKEKIQNQEKTLKDLKNDLEQCNDREKKKEIKEKLRKEVDLRQLFDDTNSIRRLQDVNIMRIRPLSRLYFKHHTNLQQGDLYKEEAIYYSGTQKIPQSLEKIQLYYSTQGDEDFNEANLIQQTTGHIYALDEKDKKVIANQIPLVTNNFIHLLIQKKDGTDDVYIQRTQVDDRKKQDVPTALLPDCCFMKDGKETGNRYRFCYVPTRDPKSETFTQVMYIGYLKRNMKVIQVAKIDFTPKQPEVELLFTIESELKKVSWSEFAISYDCNFVSACFFNNNIKQETVIYKIDEQKDGELKPYAKPFGYDLLLSPNFQYGISHEHGMFKKVQLMQVLGKPDTNGNHPEFYGGQHPEWDKDPQFNKKDNKASNRLQQNLLEQGKKQKKSVFPGLIHEFWSPDSRFIGIETTDNDYIIYRTEDGSIVARFENTYFSPVLQRAQGGSTVIVGIVDKFSRKTLPWSIKGLIHLTTQGLHLFDDDRTEVLEVESNNNQIFKKETRKDEELKKQLKEPMTIIGQPMPALYGQMLKKIDMDQENDQLIHMVDNYALAVSARKKDIRGNKKKKIRQGIVDAANVFKGDESQDRYEGYVNILQYLSMKNHDYLLEHRLCEPGIRYLSFQESALFVAEAQTGDPLVDFICSEGQEDIIKRLETDELRTILTLPQETAEKFYNFITRQNKTCFFNRNKAEINFSSFVLNQHYDISLIKAVGFTDYNQLTSTKDLSKRKDMSSEMQKNDKILFKPCIEDDKPSESYQDDSTESKKCNTCKQWSQNGKYESDPKPVVVNTVLCRMPLGFGSQDSVDFHTDLSVYASHDCFNTPAIANLIRHKFIVLLPVIMLETVLYLTYFFMIRRYIHFGVVLGFMIQQFAFLLLNYKNSADGFRFITNGFNILDIIRLASQLNFLLQTAFFHGEQVGQINAISILYLLAWLGLLKYIRYVPRVSIYVYFVMHAIYSFWYMFILLGLITAGFITAWYFKASQFVFQRMTLNDGNLQDSVHDQIKLTFGDFGNFDAFFDHMDQADYSLFMVSIILSTLIIFNLLVAIFTDTYDEIKQNEKSLELRLMNEVVREIESYIKFFTRNMRPNMPQHLVYVEYQKTSQHVWQGKVKETTSIIHGQVQKIEERFTQRVNQIEQQQVKMLDLMNSIQEKAKTLDKNKEKAKIADK